MSSYNPPKQLVIIYLKNIYSWFNPSETTLFDEIHTQKSAKKASQLKNCEVYKMIKMVNISMRLFYYLLMWL